MVEELGIEAFAAMILRARVIINWKIESERTDLNPRYRRVVMAFDTDCPVCSTRIRLPFIVKWKAGQQPSQEEIFRRFEATIKERGGCPACGSAVDKLLMHERTYLKRGPDGK